MHGITTNKSFHLTNQEIQQNSLEQRNKQLEFVSSVLKQHKCAMKIICRSLVIHSSYFGDLLNNFKTYLCTNYELRLFADEINKNMMNLISCYLNYQNKYIELNEIYHMLSISPATSKDNCSDPKAETPLISTSDVHDNSSYLHTEPLLMSTSEVMDLMDEALNKTVLLQTKAPSKKRKRQCK